MASPIDEMYGGALWELWASLKDTPTVFQKVAFVVNDIDTTSTDSDDGASRNYINGDKLKLPKMNFVNHWEFTVTNSDLDNIKAFVGEFSYTAGAPIDGHTDLVAGEGGSLQYGKTTSTGSRNLQYLKLIPVKTSQAKKTLWLTDITNIDFTHKFDDTLSEAHFVVDGIMRDNLAFKTGA